MRVSYDVVVPTLGRPGLNRLPRSLATGDRTGPGHVVVVDDRGDRSGPLLDEPLHGLQLEVIPGQAAGPASARNLGWRVFNCCSWPDWRRRRRASPALTPVWRTWRRRWGRPRCS